MVFNFGNLLNSFSDLLNWTIPACDSSVMYQEAHLIESVSLASLALTPLSQSSGVNCQCSFVSFRASCYEYSCTCPTDAWKSSAIIRSVMPCVFLTAKAKKKATWILLRSVFLLLNVVHPFLENLFQHLLSTGDKITVTPAPSGEESWCDLSTTCHVTPSVNLCSTKKKASL